MRDLVLKLSSASMAERRLEPIRRLTREAEDAGSTIELSFLDSRAEAKVAPAWDPPLQGAEADRVPRVTESYYKEFHPLRMGVIRLPKSRGKLTLRAVKIPGKRVADIRYVALTYRGPGTN